MNLHPEEINIKPNFCNFELLLSHSDACIGDSTKRRFGIQWSILQSDYIGYQQILSIWMTIGHNTKPADACCIWWRVPDLSCIRPITAFISVEWSSSPVRMSHCCIYLYCMSSEVTIICVKPSRSIWASSNRELYRFIECQAASIIIHECCNDNRKCS